MDEHATPGERGDEARRGDDPSDALPPTPPATPSAVVPVDLRDYVTFSDEAAQRVRILAGTTLAVDVWCLEPRQATPVLHLPDVDVAYTVVGGRSWFVTDDGEIGLDPLGAMLVPAGTVHGIDNRAPDPLIVLAVSSPPTSEPPTTPVEARGAAVHRDPSGPGRLRRALAALLGPARTS